VVEGYPALSCEGFLGAADPAEVATHEPGWTPLLVVVVVAAVAGSSQFASTAAASSVRRLCLLSLPRAAAQHCIPVAPRRPFFRLPQGR